MRGISADSSSPHQRAAHLAAAPAACGAGAQEGRSPEAGREHGGGELALYDKVLVDAECTHDGSLRHMAKFKGQQWTDFRDKFLRQLAELHSLQRRLLLQGFRLLRVGGTLVYSTCSLTRAQNEDVVQWLLNSQDGAVCAVPIEQAEGWPARAGGIPGSVRLDPLVSNTSALFICKLHKISLGAPSAELHDN
mmetsp:Transcript_29990/g.84610  ORF Transcript_29990/g.84610 Transcript_29990/m.84610 type:complete len:192 (-) Transcript_29990:89-664(-)